MLRTSQKMRRMYGICGITFELACLLHEKTGKNTVQSKLFGMERRIG